MHRLQIADVFTHGFMQQTTAALPTTQVTHDLVQEQVGDLLPGVPFLQVVEVFRATHPPIQVHRVFETLLTTVLDQAVHLRHAGAGRDQDQRAVWQIAQVRVAKRQLKADHLVALQLLDQAASAVFAHQHVQLKVTPRVRRTGQ